jgi:hypothetical protein
MNIHFIWKPYNTIFVIVSLYLILIFVVEILETLSVYHLFIMITEVHGYLI